MTNAITPLHEGDKFFFIDNNREIKEGQVIHFLPTGAIYGIYIDCSNGEHSEKMYLVDKGLWATSHLEAISLAKQCLLVDRQNLVEQLQKIDNQISALHKGNG